MKPIMSFINKNNGNEKVLEECLKMLASLTSIADRSDAVFLIDQLLDFDFIEIAYGILLNSNTNSKQRLLWLLDNLTLDSDKVWMKIYTEKYLFNAIVDLMSSNDHNLRLESLCYMVNFIEMANPELLLTRLNEDKLVLINLFKGASTVENDLTLMTRLLDSIEKMIKWDRSFQFPIDTQFTTLIENSGGFDYLEQMK